MSLLDLLTGIDLSAITGARGQIGATLDSDAVQGLLSSGAMQSAMSELGGGIGALRTDFSDPAALLQPLVNQVVSLTGSFSADSLPLADYIRAVGDGAAIVAGLLDGLEGDPIKLGRLFGLMPDGVLGQARTLFEGYTSIDLSGINRFKTMVESVETGVPTNPALFAEMALDILLPIPRNQLQEIRTALTTVITQCNEISLPSTRNAGLLTAFAQIKAAAQARNPIQLSAALAALQAARANTVLMVTSDLQRISSLIDTLPIETLAAPLGAANAVLGRAEQGVMEFLGSMGGYLDLAQAQVETLTAEQVREHLDKLNELIETSLRTYVKEPIEAQVRRAEAWMRGLLAQIPLAGYRAMVTDFILSIAKAINDADLDRPAREIRAMLNQIESVVDPTIIKDKIEEALAFLQDTLGEAIDQITGALSTVTSGVNAIASSVQGILEQAAAAIAAFRTTIDQITAAVDSLGIEAAVNQVVDALAELRATAETVLGSVPLPEALRPAIEQLIGAIEDIDLDAALAPVMSAAQELQIPDSVGATVNQGLDKVAEILKNLIPAQLIADIEAQVNDFLAQLQQFDPSSFLSGLDTYVDEAKTFLLGLDPRPAVESIRGPFQEVLDTIDRLHPARLLEPVAEAYDSLMSNIRIPSTAGMTNAVGTALNSAGQSIVGGLTSAVDEATGAAISATTTGTSSSGSGAGAQTPPPELRYKPGDALRMLGYLPQKLREALAALEAGPAGEVVAAIDSMVGGLARDLRSLRATLYAIEARVDAQTEAFLAPLARAQLDAQLSIQINMRGSSFDCAEAVSIVAQAGPGALRSDLRDANAQASTALVRRTSSTIAALGAQLERAANALERCSLASVGASLDTLLSALDVEPIAAKLDSLAVAVIQKAASLLGGLEEAIMAFYNRLRQSLTMFNPTALAQQFLGLIDLLKEQLDLLNPRRLAAELGQIHAAIRDAVAAYDPAVFAQEVWEIIERIVTGLDGLKPSELLAGFSFSAEFTDKIAALVPTEALKGIDTSLNEVGEQLAALDPAALLEAVNGLAPRVVGQFEDGLERIKQEILTLLNAVRFASGSASASVSVG
jgi:hypothetical protein